MEIRENRKCDISIYFRLALAVVAIKDNAEVSEFGELYGD
jgi:hypothetical protein